MVSKVRSIDTFAFFYFVHIVHSFYGLDCTDGTDESSMHCDAKIEYRLMDGTELEGRLEVKYRGVWGTVCDDDFGAKEAQVFCNSLGFTGPAVCEGPFIFYRFL